ncbi:hypothetical protein [Allobranchiibius sp. GilTou38]|uniref:hypothetical protein n=1 Tax=Allobranchiibius sp. GilTou38 TaxID=2815210 RepID=UPI001AA1512F|nr:hypothetical protein [Allobranchiibius sp. GilTou38]MBO1766462.1 hypothetical protein [Allobranchiibius sp. GilTou38]
MSSPTHGWLRSARAAVVAVTALGLAVGAHRVGGGTLPGAARCGWLALITFALCWACTSRRLGRAAIAGLLGGLQLALHVGLMVLGPPMAGPASAPMSMNGHAAAGPSPDLLHIGGWMLLAHVVATALTAVVLARGEQAVWFVARLVRALLPVAAVRMAPATRTSHVRASRVLAATHAGHVLGGIGRRGPPLAVL